jgi:hypothetical protein
MDPPVSTKDILTPEKSTIGTRFWICPHVSVSQREALNLFTSFRPKACKGNPGLLPRCRGFGCKERIRNNISRLPSTSGPEKTPDRFTLRSSICLLSAEIGSEDPSLASFYLFHSRGVKDSLAELKLPLCSHMKLSDTIVSNHYNPRCLLLQKLDGRCLPCVCRRTQTAEEPWGNHFKYCPECETAGDFASFGFRANESLVEGRRCLRLVIQFSRRLGVLEGSPTINWSCLSFNDAEIRSFH